MVKAQQDKEKIRKTGADFAKKQIVKFFERSKIVDSSVSALYSLSALFPYKMKDLASLMMLHSNHPTANISKVYEGGDQVW